MSPAHSPAVHHAAVIEAIPADGACTAVVRVVACCWGRGLTRRRRRARRWVASVIASREAGQSAPFLPDFPPPALASRAISTGTDTRAYPPQRTPQSLTPSTQTRTGIHSEYVATTPTTAAGRTSRTFEFMVARRRVVRDCIVLQVGQS